MSSSYRMELDRWLSQLNVSAKTVLDIGGSQLPVKGRTLSWNVQRYLIADLPTPHADSMKPDIEMDLNTEDIPVSPNEFDVVFCLEVFDYIWNPYQAMANIAWYIKPGGIAWITFPSIYPLHQPVEDDGLRYMPGGIQKLADSVDLTIEEMIPRRFESDLWERTYRTERMRAAKHEDHNFSGWIVRFKK